MEIQVGHNFLPPFNLPQGISCVYKLHFPSDFFYIGSTVNMARRLGSHINRMKSPKYLKWDKDTYGIMKLLSIEILFISRIEEDIRNVERDILKGNSKDKLCLNCFHKPKRKTYELDDIEIITLVSKDYTIRQIAEKLNVTSRAIECLLFKLRQKLSAKNICHLMMVYLRNGWIT